MPATAVPIQPELPGNHSGSFSKERNQGEKDLEFFAKTFFPEFCTHDFSEMHRELFARRKQKISEPLDARRGSIDVVLAPRGSAKSTLVSLIFTAHAILYGLERYIIILSATERQAVQRLAALRGVFLTNPHLREHFQDRLDLLSRKSAQTLELGDVRIDALSAGTELRGMSHGPWRPTWVILDDVERSERVRKACHRDQLADWFAEVVGNLGSAYTHIDLVGTLLHRDALPARLAKRPDVRFRKHTAIIKEADNTELWNQWRARLCDLGNPDREANAREFFKAHEAEMLSGSKVLWPAREPYYDLMRLRETSGRAAFDKEKQNAPWADGTAVFAGLALRRFRIESGMLLCDPPPGDDGAITPHENGRPQVALDELRVFGFLDPALGGDGGDFAAIATVGADPDGYLYLLDVWLAHAGPSEQVQRIFDLYERWGHLAIGIEGNAFQCLLHEPIEAERVRRRNQGRPWQLSTPSVKHKGDKQTRILTLEPRLHSGWLLLNCDLPEEFMAQLLDFPNAAHDDGPDAVAAAVERACNRLKPLQTESVPRKAPGAMGNF